MDGLECSEVALSDLEFSGRIDAEYYRKSLLEYESQIVSLKHTTLQDIANFLIGPFGSAYDTSNYVPESDYRYVRGQDVKPFILKDNESRFIAQADYERLAKYSLKEQDVMISVVGTLGNACLVRSKDLPAIFSCKSTVVRTEKLNPYYLTAYLNSKYGSQLLLRKERGAIQKGLNLDDLKNLVVPVFSEILQNAIERSIRYACEMLDNSMLEYSKAEQLLLDELGMTDFTPSAEKVSVKNFADSFGISGRLDAEYYQKKYDDYLQYVHNYCRGYTSIYKKFQQIKTTFQRVKNEYPYVEIGDINVGDGTYSYHLTSVEDLPANAKIKVKMNDLIVSKVRPYRGAVSIIRHNLQDLVVSGAFTVLRRTSDYSIETLAVLFKTPIYRDWFLKWNVGSSYPVIKDEDVMNIPIPLFGDDIHNIVKTSIISSENLKQKSAELLEQAQQAVEMAIEKDEQTAMDWLNNLK